MSEVSVIIATHNRCRLLGEALDSCGVQGAYVSEVIVVDDGSTDETEAVVTASRSESGISVRYVRQPNSGAATARNTGLSLAVSDYVLFLDDDDRLLPGGVEKLVKEARRHPHFVAIGGRARYLSADGSRLTGVTGQMPIPLPMDQIRRAQLNPWPPACCIIQRCAALTVAGFDHEHSALAGFPEDLDFWCRLSGTGDFGVIPDVVSAYRVHRDAESSRNAVATLHGTRYVQYLAESRAVGDYALDYASWRSKYSPGLNRQERARLHYRAAGLGWMNRRFHAAVGNFTVALLLRPFGTLGRLAKQYSSTSNG